MNYYEHHLGDWAAATGHLTWDEDMAYTRLLRAYYHYERAIPDGQQYRLAKASTPGQRKAVDQVLAEFFDLREGHHHQKRADAEIARYQDKQRKAKASADARWSQCERNANASPSRNANAMRTHSEGNALQTPDTRHQTPDKGNTGERARGARLPSDWLLPDCWGEWAKTARPDLDPQVTASKFRDYWTAKPGASGRKLDWQATWRNWVRDERPPLRAINGGAAEPAWRTEQRERTEAFAGPAAAKRRTNAPEIVDATTRLLG